MLRCLVVYLPGLCLQNMQSTNTVLHKYYTKLAQMLQKYCTNPALTAVENLQPTNTTTPLPCITICQILAKLHQHERKRGCLALFGYIQMYWSSCCQCIRKAFDLFTYQIVHHTHTVNKLKTYAKQAIELFPNNLTKVSTNLALLLLADFFTVGSLYRGLL